MTLFDLLEESASSPARVVFPTLRRTATVGDLWDQAGRVSRWVRTRTPVDGTVATLLDTSPECLAFFLGALRSGRRVASLPLPPRSASAEQYEELARSILEQIDASVVVVDQRFLGLVPVLEVPTTSFQAVVSAASPAFDDPVLGGEFVQFTSGSTANPKGVRLSIEQIGANVESMLDRLEPAPGDGACSWLPLSHDMGLIGMTLASLCAGGPRYANGGELVLISPEHFLRDPAVWLRMCAEHRSTITASPDFGLDLSMRRGASSALDLSRLRACIVGGEPIRPTTLHAFSTGLASSGFRPEALCPSYGLAEATLGVTMLPPAEHWRALHLDEAALAGHAVMPVSHGGTAVVSSGLPLSGVEVSVAGADMAVGSIRVEGDSVFEGYLGQPASGGTIVTDDTGFLADGHLYVLGRADDVVVVRGRNLHAADLEGAVERVEAVRPGSSVVVAWPAGYAVVFESDESKRSTLGTCAESVRRALVDHCGVQPERVVIVERGAVPKTSSGKKRRQLVAHELMAGELDGLHDRSYATV